jgi:hypothetical protein
MPSYDSAWKELLDRFLDLVLMLLFPDVWQAIDWSEGYEPLDPALRKIVPEGETGDRLADKLILARAKKTHDPRLLHFEVQGKKQHEFERRVYGYNYRAFDSLAMPPEALIILADEDRDWRPTRYEVALVHTTLTFTFQPVKLLDWRPRLEELRTGENLAGLFVVAHLEALRTAKDVKGRADVKLGLLLNLAERKLDEEDTRVWYKLLDLLLDLPPETDRAVYLEASRLTREKAMPFVTFAERYGREQGEIKGLLAGLELGLGLKFGADGVALMPDVRRIEDPARLLALIDKLKSDVSLDDVRKFLAAPPDASAS